MNMVNQRQFDHINQLIQLSVIKLRDFHCEWNNNCFLIFFFRLRLHPATRRVKSTPSPTTSSSILQVQKAWLFYIINIFVF
jgi:hypothetical protein